jgi:hypothetical protein
MILRGIRNSKYIKLSRKETVNSKKSFRPEYQDSEPVLIYENRKRAKRPI